MILVIDNYDSFVHNLARQIRLLGSPTRVIRNDEKSTDELLAMKPDAIVMSPGPCTPNEAGVCLELTSRLLLAGGVLETPLLGVCLGHQVICQAMGGRIVRAARPVHGQASWIHHDGASIFGGLASPIAVGRYHSLIAERDSLPRDLVATAWTGDGVIMAVQHRTKPVVGVQFHPESLLTELGPELLAAFLGDVAKIKVIRRETRELRCKRLLQTGERVL